VVTFYSSLYRLVQTLCTAMCHRADLSSLATVDGYDVVLLMFFKIVYYCGVVGILVCVLRSKEKIERPANLTDFFFIYFKMISISTAKSWQSSRTLGEMNDRMDD